MATYVQEFQKIAQAEARLSVVAPPPEVPYHNQEAESFTTLGSLAEPVTISPAGTLNTIPKFTGATTIGDSIMREVAGIAIVIGTDPLVAGDAGETAPFRIGVTATNKQLIELGPGGGTTRARIVAASADMYQFRLNVNTAATAFDDAAKPSWFWRMGASADLFAVDRAPAGSFVFVDLLVAKGTGEVDVTVGPFIIGVDPLGADILRVGGNARIGGTLTLITAIPSGSNITMQAGGRIDMRFQNTAGALDEKIWDISVDGVGGTPTFAFVMRNDAGGAGTQWLRAVRVGNVLSQLQLASGSAVGDIIVGVDPAGGQRFRLGGTSNLAGSVTVSTGDLTLTTGRLIFGAANGKILMGATTLSIRDSADTANIASLTATGALALTGTAAELVLGPRGGGGASWELYVQATAAFRLYHAGDQYLFSDTDFTPSVTLGKTLGTAAIRWGKFWGQDADFTTTITLAGQLTSTVVTGTAPFVVASTTKVVNLNADLLDDQSGAFYLDLANATGNLPYARLPTGGGVWANGGTLSITGGITTVAGLTSTAQVLVNGGANPTVAAASTLALGGGGITPNGTSITWGDNTGWKIRFGTVVAAAFTPRFSILDTGLVEVVTGDLTVTAGRLTFGAAVGKIVPGATSISLRNNADSADNLLMTDGGVSTFRNHIEIFTGAAVIGPGTTELAICDGTRQVGLVANAGFAVGVGSRSNHDFLIFTNNVTRVTFLAADSSIELIGGGYIQQTEMAAPGTPAANKTRDYAKDVGGVSTRFWKDDAGVEHPHNLTLIDTQTFTATGAGTWTKPAGAVLVLVDVVGGGGGGGGGRGGNALTTREGGQGGGGGARMLMWFKAADLGATEALSVGAGGTAGTGGSGAAGTAGGQGGDTWFGNATQANAKLWAFGGGLGGASYNGVTIQTGGSGGGILSAGAQGNTATNGGSPNNGLTGQGQGYGGAHVPTSGAGVPAVWGGASGGGNGTGSVGGQAGGVSQYGGGGGGSGGAVNGSNVESGGGAGGNNTIGQTGGGGAAGAANGGAGGAGGAGDATRSGQGGGGGGGQDSGTGGVGGAGGIPGGGGGGGGGGTTVGGAGGVGARGEVRVYSFA